jgi:MinD-like ATPase involved in chromosome partitioning or flagellar assembly
MVPASLSSRVAIVVTAEPKQLNQARALVSRVRTLKPQMEIGVAVNRVTTSGQAIAVFRDLSHGLNLDYLGHCPEDEKFAQAVTGGKYLLDYDIGAPSYRCLETLAQRMKPLTVPIQEETETSAQRMRGVIG